MSPCKEIRVSASLIHALTCGVIGVGGIALHVAHRVAMRRC